MINGTVARYGERKKPLTFIAMSRFSNEQLLDQGETFFLHRDQRINKVPLVRLFGPGYYWRATTHDGVEVVGQGTDGVNVEQWYLIADGRRRGEIYGKWFSRFCRQGEFGSRDCGDVEPISEHVYNETVRKLGEGE